MEPKILIFTFLIAFLVSFSIVPFLIKIALKLNIVDLPNQRKVHKDEIPLLGGVGIFVGAFVSIISTRIYFNNNDLLHFNSQALSVLIGGIAMVVLGIYDDKYGSNARSKFFVQFIAAGFVIYSGLYIENITNPFTGGSIALGWFGIILTFFWIVGITNAINLTDGLDGLASGIVMMACVSLSLISLKNGQYFTLLVSTALIGSILAFLKYNFNPARIFMGDSGSLFLGFTVACISLQGAQLSSTAVALIVPIIALGVPIVDTLMAIARRALLGRNPFAADKEHIHHRLMNFLGMSHRAAVLSVYGACLVFGGLAVMMVLVNDEYTAYVLLLMGILIIVGIRRLGYIEYIGAERKLMNMRKNIILISNEKNVYSNLKENFNGVFRFYNFKHGHNQDEKFEKQLQDQNKLDMVLFQLPFQELKDCGYFKVIKQCEFNVPILVLCDNENDWNLLNEDPFFMEESLLYSEGSEENLLEKINEMTFD